MKDPRTEVVSVRLTKAERERLDAMGGATAVLRRALIGADLLRVPTTQGLTGFGNGHGALIWSDGTCSQQWPLATAP